MESERRWARLPPEREGRKKKKTKKTDQNHISLSAQVYLHSNAGLTQTFFLFFLFFFHFNVNQQKKPKQNKTQKQARLRMRCCCQAYKVECAFVKVPWSPTSTARMHSGEGGGLVEGSEFIYTACQHKPGFSALLPVLEIMQRACVCVCVLQAHQAAQLTPVAVRLAYTYPRVTISVWWGVPFWQGVCLWFACAKDIRDFFS